MNECLIANVNFRMLASELSWRKIKRKNNTRCNNAEGEQVRKVAM